MENVDPLHELGLRIFYEIKAPKIELYSDGVVEITVWRKTEHIDIPSILTKYGFDVSDCNIREIALYGHDCIGAFRGQVGGKIVNGLIFYDNDKEMVLYIRMSYQPQGGIF